ncbi:MAG: 4-hydroxy-tetrahydrodipicolinate reductase [Kofleriaceae bacterium]
MSSPRLCVLGPSGRMGAALVGAAAEAGLAVTAAVDRADAPSIGAKVGGVTVTAALADALAACDVYIDFTTPGATAAAARAATAARRAAVIGTTGLDADADAAVAALAEVAPVVVAANFSLGVNLLLGLARQAAAALDDGWDAEIVEAHHGRKVDAPSGTALALVAAVEAGRGRAAAHAHGRQGQVGARPRGEIGVHAVRGGDVVGEHTLTLFAAGERVELSHRATDRAIFARGAVRAAAWVVGRAPGRYDMQDVLGLR